MPEAKLAITVSVPAVSVITSVDTSIRYVSLPAPPIKVSLPVPPSSTLFPVLPVIVLTLALPVASMLPDPLRVMFSTLALMV